MMTAKARIRMQYPFMIRKTKNQQTKTLRKCNLITLQPTPYTMPSPRTEGKAVSAATPCTEHYTEGPVQWRQDETADDMSIYADSPEGSAKSC